MTKYLREINTLAYQSGASVTKGKSFMTLASGQNFYRHSNRLDPVGHCGSLLVPEFRTWLCFQACWKVVIKLDFAATTVTTVIQQQQQQQQEQYHVGKCQE
jgi:hypothetical protein